MSDSSERYAFRRSPRLRSAQLSADSEDRSSQISTSQRAENDVQDEESENDVQDEESQNPSDDDSGTPSTVCPVDSPINAVPSREASEDTHASEQPTEEGPDSPLEPSPNRRTFDSFSISPGRSGLRCRQATLKKITPLDHPSRLQGRQIKSLTKTMIKSRIQSNGLWFRLATSKNTPTPDHPRGLPGQQMKSLQLLNALP
ncbi:uncharacterized protein PGTG_14236 [Puccinia graminis f. sp. tritici CRL 75-36-700-3]|uniref:Uncharacterized protein n=1 Tax=Puccinia graminis f. sp. tritici (strain CRL 75-36-700-3 / race SCCL) TaxID=418459 RepID=E3KX04_PUCGT|nr:uncharacterized protein PGTG_14236 [Puccinia graminis f. sp. tritici CRL 75-36-700-3]EFP88897.1 hypothetical protein PGTG_14236 [Puccinia graminis f. sp. tritici CRL 75-36-700-3]